MFMRNSQKRFVIFAIWGCLFVTRLTAQHIIEANSADPADMRVLFINPAFPSLANPHFMIGIKFFNVGFLNSNALGLRNNYMTFSISKVPYLNTGLGASFYHIATPIFTKTNLGLNLSKEFFNRIYLGGKLSIFSSGFNRDQFDLIQEDDPVFRNTTSKTSLGIGCGFLIRPMENVTVGCSADNLNEPNISLINDAVVEAKTIDLAINYLFKIFSLSGGLTLSQSHYYPNFAVRYNYWDLLRFNAGYGHSGMLLGCQLQITDRIQMNYQFDYPLSEITQQSYGSHQFNICYYLTKPEEPISVFDFMLDKDSLFIYEKWFNKQFDPSIPDTLLPQSLDAGIPRYVDVFPSDSIHADFEPKYYSRRYHAFFDTIAQLIKADKNIQVRIIDRAGNISKAFGILNFLQSKLEKPCQQISIVDQTNPNDSTLIKSLTLIKEDTISGNSFKLYMSSNQTDFHISSTDNMRVDEWRMIISRSSGEEIIRFEGKRWVPEKINWDWRDSKGGLLEPGWYYGILKWKNKNGTVRLTSKKFFKGYKIVELRLSTFN